MTISQLSISNQFNMDRANTPVLIENSGEVDTEFPISQTDLKVFANGKVMKVQKSRQRRILSCVYCHSKKIKCSREQPICNNCDKLGLECKYFVNQRVSRGGKKSSRLEESKRATSSNSSSSYSPPQKFSSPVVKKSSPTLNYSAPVAQNYVAEYVEDMDLNTEMEGHNFMNQHIKLEVTSPISPGAQDSLTPTVGMLPGMFVNDLGIANDVQLNGITNDAQNSINENGVELRTQHIQLNSQLNDDMQIAGNRAVFSVQTPPLTFNSPAGSYFGATYPAKYFPTKEDDQYSFGASSFTIAQPNQLNSHQSLNIQKSNVGTPSANTGSNISTLMNFPNSHNNSSSNISVFFTRNIDNLFSTVEAESSQRNQNRSGPSDPISKNYFNQMTPPIANLNLANLNSKPPNPPQINNLNAFKPSPATSVNYLYGTNSYYANENLLEDLVNHLPKSKERSFELINRYVNSVHILLPILINLPEFLKEHERYWQLNEKKNAAAQKANQERSKFQSVSSDSSNTSPSISGDSTTGHDDDFNYLQFHTLYFPVLYAATISEFEEYDNLLLNQDIDRYLKAFNKICQYHNYPHGLKTIPILLGNVIIQSTSPNPSTMEMSLIIRYAKFLQLHKDPAITLHITNWEVIKFRRLLWWDIFGLDALTCHNFCLAPVCRFTDFNVLMPDEQEPVFNESGEVLGTTLNVSILSMNVKFKYDTILSEMVYHLNNGITTNITGSQIKEIKTMINDLFLYIQEAIKKLNAFFKVHPPSSVQEMNLINFIKNHSWSFVDRALMLLHRKILMSEGSINVDPDSSILNSAAAAAAAASVAATRSLEPKDGALSLTQYEDTFGFIQEANIIKNFDKCSISQLKFNQHENFLYDNLHNNLIPSILHNLNDFLKYNDFIKFGKYNWYIKRTIPIDSIILMFIIITIKFKYEIMLMDELCIYVKLINKAMFILNRKWFKNEKYKRMLTLTSSTWEFILKRYNVISLINKYRESSNGRIEFYDYQLTGYMSMNDLFNVMDVPEPILIEDKKSRDKIDTSVSKGSKLVSSSGEYFDNSLVTSNGEVNQRSNELAISSIQMTVEMKADLLQLNEKIYYDLRNNFVDINACCAFYTSLEHILHELMDYIHRP